MNNVHMKAYVRLSIILQCVHNRRADSGFRHVKPTEYKPHLLHFHGDKVRYAYARVGTIKSRTYHPSAWSESGREASE